MSTITDEVLDEKKSKTPKVKNLKSLLDDYEKKEILTTTKENNYTVVSTGSMAMDVATGVGGFPLGKFIEIFAWEGVGKSTIAMQTIGNAQKMGLKCALIEPECSYDYDYGKALGVNKDDLIMLHPEVTEDAANITVDLIKTGEVDVIVLDSLSALSTQKELEGSIGDSTIGVKARLVGQLCRKVKNELRKKNVLFIVIGQCREKITMYGDPLTTDYGNAVKFFADIRIQMTKKVNEKKTANNVIAKFIKNKVGKPFIECEFSIEFGKGVNNFMEIINLARDYKIIKKFNSMALNPKKIYQLKLLIMRKILP